MSGTWSASLGGIPIQLLNSTSGLYSISDIPFNAESGAIEQALRNIIGFESVEVERSGDPLIGVKWIIYYIGYNKDLPDIVVSAAGLIGGRTGTTPEILSATRRNFSTNLFVDPIDYRWMRTFSDKPNVRVTVDGIPSACNSDCTYTFLSDVPTITSLSRTGASLTIGITSATLITATLNDLTVTLDGQICGNLIGTVDSFTCDLPKNADNTPILTAGSYYPQVTISQLGLVSIDPTVNPIAIDLLLNAPSTTTGGVNGGYQITLTGSGFPSNPTQITFTLCSQLCTIISLNNVAATVLVPSCSTEGLTQI
jgi:hypothetical protein